MRVSIDRWLEWGRRLGFLALVTLVAVTAVAALPGVFGLTDSYVIDSQSATSTLQSGDVVLVDSVHPSEYRAGDFVVLRVPAEDTVVLRRVVDVDRRGGETTVIAAEPSTGDRTRVAPNRVVGKVVLTLPMLGTLFIFGRSTGGVVTLIGIPLAVLVATTIRSRLRDDDPAASGTDRLDWPNDGGENG